MAAYFIHSLVNVLRKIALEWTVHKVCNDPDIEHSKTALLPFCFFFPSERNKHSPWEGPGAAGGSLSVEAWQPPGCSGWLRRRGGSCQEDRSLGGPQSYMWEDNRTNKEHPVSQSALQLQPGIASLWKTTFEALTQVSVFQRVLAESGWRWQWPTRSSPYQRCWTAADPMSPAYKNYKFVRKMVSFITSTDHSHKRNGSEQFPTCVLDQFHSNQRGLKPCCCAKYRMWWKTFRKLWHSKWFTADGQNNNYFDNNSK